MLLAISAGLYIFLFLMIFVLAGSRGGGGPGGDGMAMAILMLMLFIGGTAVGAAGLATIVSVPAVSTIKGIAIAGTISMGIATVTGLITTVMILSGSGAGPGGGGSAMILILITVSGLQAGFIFTQFLMAILAKHLKSPGMQASVVGMGAFWAAGPTFILGASTFAPLMGAGRGGMGMGGEPANPLVTLIMVILGAGAWFIVNTIMLGSAVNSARRRGDI
jgi:hypothetical protein